MRQKKHGAQEELEHKTQNQQLQSALKVRFYREQQLGADSEPTNTKLNYDSGEFRALEIP